MQVETGMMPPETKESLEPLEDGRGRDGFFLKVLRGSVALSISDSLDF